MKRNATHGQTWKIWTTGMMMAATCLHHFQSGTPKILDAWPLLHKAYQDTKCHISEGTRTFPFGVIKLLVSIICEIICAKTYTKMWWHTFHVKEKETQCNLMWSPQVSLTKETESLFTYSLVQNSLCFLIQNTENNCNVSVGLWTVNSEYYNTNVTDGEYWQCSLVSKLHGCSKLRNTVQSRKI
jgi:hypothetical protein